MIQISHRNARTLALLAWASVAAIARSQSAEVVNSREPKLGTQWTVLDRAVRPWKSPAGPRLEEPMRFPDDNLVEPLERRETADPPISWLRIRVSSRDGWLPEALLAPPPCVASSELQTIGAEAVDRWRG